MPIYEYKCRDCGSVSELLVGVTSEQPDIACEDCGSAAVDRLMSQISFSIHGEIGSFDAAESACGCGGSCSCESSGGCSCGGSCACG